MSDLFFCSVYVTIQSLAFTIIGIRTRPDGVEAKPMAMEEGKVKIDKFDGNDFSLRKM